MAPQPLEYRACCGRCRRHIAERVPDRTRDSVACDCPHRSAWPSHCNRTAPQICLCDFGSAKLIAQPPRPSIAYITSRYYRWPCAACVRTLLLTSIRCCDAPVPPLSALGGNPYRTNAPHDSTVSVCAQRQRLHARSRGMGPSAAPSRPLVRGRCTSPRVCVPCRAYRAPELMFDCVTCAPSYCVPRL